MAKVDWITWKTDTDEIINTDKSTTIINTLIDDSSKYINDIVYESINHEIKSGGLDTDSLNIVGTSPAYERANKILNITTNIKEDLESLKVDISQYIQDQHEIEKQQLTEAIQKKIDEETKILETTNILKDKLSLGSNVVNMQEVLNIISVTEEKIKKLQERLEKAKSL